MIMIHHIVLLLVVWVHPDGHRDFVPYTPSFQTMEQCSQRLNEIQSKLHAPLLKELSFKCVRDQEGSKS